MGLTKISTDGVKDDAITKAKIPANQIEASELANNAVDTNAIQDDAVNNAKLADGAVHTANLSDDSVSNAKLVDGSVHTSTLSDTAVTTSKINNQAVTTDKIANNAVTSDKLPNSGISFAKITNIPQNRIAGRISSGSGVLQELTAANVRSIINVEDGATAGGGKILQTVNATTSSQVENTTGSYYDTNLSASITLSAANKVLIFVAQQLEARQYNATGFSVGRLILVRTTSGSSTNVFAGGRSVVTSGPGSGSYFVASGCIASIIAEDSPGVGTHNYKTRIARIVGGGGTAVRANSDGHPAEIILMEIAA